MKDSINKINSRFQIKDYIGSKIIFAITLKPLTLILENNLEKICIHQDKHYFANYYIYNVIIVFIFFLGFFRRNL